MARTTPARKTDLPYVPFVENRGIQPRWSSRKAEVSWMRGLRKYSPQRP